jgi:phosphate transport system protein
MQTYFEDELARLRTRMIKMMKIVSSQIDKSFRVLFDKDLETIEIIKHDENKLDKLDIKIDKLCQRIFALTQPVATDLRFIMASLKIGTELERIGDIVYDISKRSEAVNQFPDILNRFEIKVLSKKIQKLYNQLIECYINSNSSLACEIIIECKKSDEACKTVFNEIVGAMTKKSEVIVVATDLILIMRDIERLFSHIENISETIIFIVDAKIVKHSESK